MSVKHHQIVSFILILVILSLTTAQADDGYRLWLRYDKISDHDKLQEYRSGITEIVFDGNTPTLTAAREELNNGLKGLLGDVIPQVDSITKDCTLVLGTPQSSKLISSAGLEDKIR